MLVFWFAAFSAAAGPSRFIPSCREPGPLSLRLSKPDTGSM